ncbi:hypothetical protein AB4090_05275 [Acidithiobacillus sp. IBUN Pt1247-S3]|uniref:hypothetical protein n=1 Tax=Acidithiobacillus sp. IBUN Pt1247-S3 TaxID=3166642 RepID=UPI0034E4219E
MKLLGREDATQTIRQLYQAYVDQYHRIPRMLIAVGGTAMAYHDMRKLSEDIDLYCPEDAFLPLAAELEAASGLRIDVTSQTTLFGQLDIRDIEKDAQVMENVEVEMDGKSFSIDIAAISPETLFVIKANTMREKDRDDLPAILEKTSPEQVFQRLEVLLSHASSWGARRDLLLNVANEMQIVSSRSGFCRSATGCMAPPNSVPSTSSRRSRRRYCSPCRMPRSISPNGPSPRFIETPTSSTPRAITPSPTD